MKEKWVSDSVNIDLEEENSRPQVGNMAQDQDYGDDFRAQNNRGDSSSTVPK